MSEQNKSPRFSRLLRELIREGQVDAPEALAAILDHKSTRMVELWMIGMAYPQDVATVRRIAENSFHHDHEVMTAWLCDRDPDGEHFYRAMLTKLSDDPERALAVMDREGAAPGGSADHRHLVKCRV